MPTPQEIYQNRIEAGQLQPDPAQEYALAALDRLNGDLSETCHPRESGNLLAFLRKVPAFAGMTEEIKGVYLHGGVGRGKSMLMDIFARSLPPEIKHRRVHFHAFMIEVHDWLHKRRGDRVDTLLPDLAKEIARDCRVLCFDELHVHDVADAMILGRLFTSLFRRGVVMVATSNYPPDELYKGGLQRDRFEPFIELLKEKTQIVHLDGATDYRSRCLREEGVYFTPLGAASQKKADEVFAHLTDHASPYEEEIEVKGRKIPVSSVAKGAARFTFSELCERPHGAEDYLAIARTYHTVFLEGVPRLTYDRRNEAKRLMTLIDALYDTKTKLVITADAPPEKLYRGRDHAFDFQRTVSRLLEMQSGTYLENRN